MSFNLELRRAEYSGVLRNHLKMSPRKTGFRKTQTEKGTAGKESLTNHVVCKMPDNRSLLGHNNEAFLKGLDQKLTITCNLGLKL